LEVSPNRAGNSRVSCGLIAAVGFRWFLVGYAVRGLSMCREEYTLVKLDEIDLRILQALQNNARIPVLDLAEHVGLSATPCSRRLRRLEDEGIIKKYVAVLNPKAMSLDVTAFLSVRVRHSPELAAKFRAAILQLPNIRGCYSVTGSYDYLLLVNAKDMQALSQWILEKVHSIPSVLHTHTSIVLESIKDEPSFLLRDLSALKGHGAGKK
jgi:Lrp/AsnC family transcriptional regulator, leucine-responsive regulatory protein